MITVDDKGRFLVHYKDQFGKRRTKHLAYVTGTKVEFRQPGCTVTIGTVITDEETGHRHIRIELPDDIS